MTNSSIWIVLLDIFASNKLIFLKKNQLRENIFYKRIGTNCLPIQFQNIEDYYEMSKKFIN